MKIIVAGALIFLHCANSFGQVAGPDAVAAVRSVQQEWKTFPIREGWDCQYQRQIAEGEMRGFENELANERNVQDQIFPQLRNLPNQLAEQVRYSDMRIMQDAKLALQSIKRSKENCLQSANRLSRTQRTTPKVLETRDNSSDTYADRVRRHVAPNILWGGAGGGLETVISVHCSPTGTLLSANITRSSGNPAWDDAALRAVQRSDPMPVNTDGKAPESFSIILGSE